MLEEIFLGLASYSEALRGSEVCSGGDGGHFGGNFVKVWEEIYLKCGRLRGRNIYTGAAAGVGYGSVTCNIGSFQSGGGASLRIY